MKKNTLLSLPSINSNTNTIEYKTSKGIIKYEINKDYSKELALIRKEDFKQYQIKDNILILNIQNAQINLYQTSKR